MRAPPWGRAIDPRRFDPRRFDPRRAFSRDLPMKVAAILLAALLWFAFVQSASGDVTVEFDGRVPIERPSPPDGYALRSTGSDVGVRLRGPAAVVAAIGQTDLVATVDLSGFDYESGQPQEMPARVMSNDARVRVVEVLPAVVSVWIERITEREIAVQVRYANDPPSGFQPGPPAITPAEVRVIGPQSQVAAVAAVITQLRFGDVGVDLVQSAQPQAVDQDGAPLSGLRVEPATVQVNVPVLPTSSTRTLPVLWNVAGNVADGYWIARVATEPATVTVRGEPAAITPLERIETDLVDVSGLTSSRSVRVGLRLPAGITLLRPTDATVTITVVPLDGTRPLPSIAVQTSGLEEGLVTEVTPATVSVVVSGQLARLGTLAATDVVATVDLTGRQPGEHRVNVTVRLPAGVSLVGVQPNAVTVTIRRS